MCGGDGHEKFIICCPNRNHAASGQHHQWTSWGISWRRLLPRRLGGRAGISGNCLDWSGLGGLGARLGWLGFSSLSLLCDTRGDHPAATSGLCRASADSAGGRGVLVLLPESPGLLPVCKEMSHRMDEGRSFTSAAGPEVMSHEQRQ